MTRSARAASGWFLAVAVVSAAGCSTSGHHWVDSAEGRPEKWGHGPAEPFPEPSHRASLLPHRRVLGQPDEAPLAVDDPHAAERWGGRVLGVFRNTYYDFPAERDYEGPAVDLFDTECKPIAEVAEGFHDSVCVQGSGVLSDGFVVSFARRDCSCARVCPRTEQRICFERLDRERFPWGRGATGRPITPLLTVAVDTDVIPLETALYIPEYDGLPTDETERATHDGCFIAQDRGLRVREKHVDIFTGMPSMTRLWNRLQPSNAGVTVVVESPRCDRFRP